MVKRTGRKLDAESGVSGREKSNFKLLWLGLLLLGAVVLLGVVVVFRERSERARLADRLTKLSNAGAPVDDATLEALYHAQTSTDVLAQWNKIFQLVKDESESSQAVGDDQAVRERLKGLRSEIALAVNTDQPCRFIEDFEATNTLLPYLSKLRSTTKLLTRHAQASIQCGVVDDAVEDCDLILGCADAIAADPFAIPGMVSIAFQTSALDVYRTCLEDNLLSESQLNTVLETCRRRGKIGDRWKLLISGERATTLTLLTDDVYEESRDVLDPYYRWLGVSGRGANNIADFFNQLEAVPTDDLQAMQLELGLIHDDWYQSVNASLLSKFENRLSSELISDFERIGRLFIQSVIKYRMTAIVVGLRLYQQRFGAFPRSLDELRQVGVEPGELRTFANGAFSYELGTTNVRLFDEDESWRLPTKVNSSSDEIRWDWTLSIESAKDTAQAR